MNWECDWWNSCELGATVYGQRGARIPEPRFGVQSSAGAALAARRYYAHRGSARVLTASRMVAHVLTPPLALGLGAASEAMFPTSGGGYFAVLGGAAVLLLVWWWKLRAQGRNGSQRLVLLGRVALGPESGVAYLVADGRPLVVVFGKGFAQLHCEFPRSDAGHLDIGPAKRAA